MSRIATSEVSEAKLAANRRNAQQSTGPRSAEGKQRASRNALKWGLFTDDHIILPGESQGDHDALIEQFWNSLHPTDAVEAAIVERMIANRWKLRRLRDLESFAEDPEFVQAEASLYASAGDTQHATEYMSRVQAYYAQLKQAPPPNIEIAPEAKRIRR